MYCSVWLSEILNPSWARLADPNILRRRIFPTGFGKVIQVHLKRARKAQRKETEAVVVHLEVQKSL